MAYGIGNGLIESVISSSDILQNIPNKQLQFSSKAMLMCLNSIVVAEIGITIYHVLKPHNETIAVCYLSTRIIESDLLSELPVCFR
ncbi:MAG: hypothetical protein Kow0098_19010 [Ignavibacteriaceae bacterium]